EPAEKQLLFPTELVGQRQQFRRHLQATARQQQHLGTTLPIDLPRRHFQHTHRLSPRFLALLAAQPHNAVAANPGRPRRLTDRPLLDHLPDGVVANAAYELAAGVEDILEQLILGVAAVDDIETTLLQGLT